MLKEGRWTLRSRHVEGVACEAPERAKFRPYEEDPEAVEEGTYQDELAWKLSAPLYAVLQCDEYAHLLK